VSRRPDANKVLLDETTGIFPRVTPCNDGSLCCNDDPQCCQDGNGIFLDENGNRASAKATAATTSYPPVSDGLERFTMTPSTSTTSTTSTSATTTSAEESSSTRAEPGAATTTSSTSPTPETSDDSDDSLGLKVGLGLGIPLAVILTAIAVYFFLRRRNGRANEGVPNPSQQQYAPYGGEVAQSAGGYPYSAGTVYSGVAKPPGYPEQHPGQHPGMYAGQQKYQQQPVEIMGHSATELDGSQYGARERYELN
jgi:hypothetical protein